MNTYCTAETRQSAHRKGPGGSARSGMVVFIVMVVVVMLSLAGLSFVNNMSVENQAVHLYGDQLQAEQLVASGVEMLKAFCSLPPEQRQLAGGWYDNQSQFRNVLVLDAASGDHRGRFRIVSPRLEQGQVVGLRYGVECESAKLNLGALLQWDQARPGAAREALLQLSGMTESMADAILDWIDPDAQRRQFGAEADYYSGLGVPYGPRNALPTSLDELLLVRDVSRQLLFGDLAAVGYSSGSSSDSIGAPALASQAGTRRLGQTQAPWVTMLTVYSAERNIARDGSPRIDLNQNDLGELHSQLQGLFDRSQADFVVAYRQFGPYAGGGESSSPRYGFRRARRLGTGPEEDEAASQVVSRVQLDLSLPARYRIESVIDLIGTRVRLRDRSGRPSAVLESPFGADRQQMQQYLPKLLDRTTTTPSKVLPGRININLAPLDVLRAIPGAGDSIAQRILTARGSSTDTTDSGRQTPAWLLTEGVVDLQQMRDLLPYITTGGDVFRARVEGFFDDGGPVARAEVVIDGTASPPRQLYRKDMRAFP